MLYLIEQNLICTAKFGIAPLPANEIRGQRRIMGSLRELSRSRRREIFSEANCVRLREGCDTHALSEVRGKRLTCVYRVRDKRLKCDLKRFLSVLCAAFSLRERSSRRLTVSVLKAKKQAGEPACFFALHYFLIYLIN